MLDLCTFLWLSEILISNSFYFMCTLTYQHYQCYCGMADRKSCAHQQQLPWNWGLNKEANQWIPKNGGCRMGLHSKCWRWWWLGWWWGLQTKLPAVPSVDLETETEAEVFQSKGELWTERKAWVLDGAICSLMLTYPGLESQLDQEFNTKRTELRTTRTLPTALRNSEKENSEDFPGTRPLFLIFPETIGSVGCSVMFDFLQHHGLWPTRLLCPWDSPGKNTGVGCHSLLQGSSWPKDWTWVSHIAGRFFTIWATREEPLEVSFNSTMDTKFV